MLLKKSLFSSHESKQYLNILLFSTSSFISLFGTSAYNFAIGLYVLKITGSGLNFATTLTIGILSVVLVSPFAGVLADRCSKKLLAIAADFINSFLLIILFFITTNYSLNLPMIYIVTFILNVSSTIYGTSIEAAKPNLVLEEKLISINSINKVIDSSSSILGPMLGGVIFGFCNINLFIIINGISFAISALLEIFIDFKFNISNAAQANCSVNIFRDIREGILYLYNKKDIIHIFMIFIVLNFFIGLSINVPMPYIINNVLKLGSRYFGIIESAFPIGMILGAALIKRIIEKYSYKYIIKSSSILLSFSMIAIGISPLIKYIRHDSIFYLIYFIALMLLSGLAISSIDIPIFYMLQRSIPDEFRGRVLSLGISAAKIVLPAALILAGALMSTIPPYVLPTIGGICLCAFSILYMKNR